MFSLTVDARDDLENPRLWHGLAKWNSNLGNKGDSDLDDVSLPSNYQFIIESMSWWHWLATLVEIAQYFGVNDQLHILKVSFYSK